MTPMEIIATLGLDRDTCQLVSGQVSWGAMGSRPIAVNGHVCLLGEANERFSGCTIPDSMSKAIRAILASPNEFTRTRLDFEGVPGPLLCSGCLGTGSHHTCCFHFDYGCCNIDKCEACNGRGQWIPARIFSLVLVEGIAVDAFYLRVILDHLETTTPAMGLVEGDPRGAIVFSHLGRDALLTPIEWPGSRLRRVELKK